MNETKRGFDDMFELNSAGFRAVCGLLNVLVVQNEAGRPLTEDEKQQAARKGDEFFWSMKENDSSFRFNSDES